MKISRRQIVSLIIMLISLWMFVIQIGDVFIEKKDWVRTTATIERFRLPKGWVSGYYVDENNVRQYSNHLYWHKFKQTEVDYEKDLMPLIGTEVEVVYDPITGESENLIYLSENLVFFAINFIIWSAYAILCFKRPDRRYIREFIAAFFKKIIFKYFLQIASVLFLIWSVSGLVSCCQKLIDVQDWITKDAVVIRAGAPWEDVTVRFLDEAGNEELQKLQMLHYGVIYEYAHSQHKDVEILYNPDTGEVAKYSRVIFNTIFFTLCWLGSSWFCMWGLKRLKRKEIN